MTPSRVAVFAALGMLFTSVSVYSFTPPGGFSRGDIASPTPEPLPSSTPENVLARATTESSQFTAGSTVMVDGRLGHGRLARDGQNRTFLMLEVRGGDPPRGAAIKPPLNLSLVIDRSGSMKGSRLRNAVSAATAAVERLSDGDVVSVVTFDTQVQTVVRPTVIGPGARERVAADIRAITLGGDTCISCGVEQGMQLLEQTGGKVNRMIVLSDGDANFGVRDVAGFRGIAQRAMSREVTISTIGVDVDYNEKILSALAQDSNGRHYFVENDAALARVFEAEADALAGTIASGAEAAIELAPGVELERVFDRSFRRSGNRVTVPLGTLARGEVKTVLLEVRVPNRAIGQARVADVDLVYRDLAGATDGRCGGKLALEIADGAAGELDPVVSGRVQRSETAATIKDANELFAQGRLVDARRKLEKRQEALQAVAEAAKRAAPAGKAKTVNDDFDRQLAAVGDANRDFAKPAESNPFASAPNAAPAPAQQTREGRSAVKQNMQRAFDMGL